MLVVRNVQNNSNSGDAGQVQPRRRVFGRGKRVKAFFAGLLMLASCAPGADMAPLPPVPPGPYHLGVGDQVRIITFGEDQLTGQFRIGDSGDIALPLLGTIHAAGDSVDALQGKIASTLKSRNLLKDPSVSVEITDYRPIFVLGEVAKPGQYPYQPGMSLLTAVAIAGGFTYRAVQDYAAVVRTTPQGKIEGKVTRVAPIQPGDVITVYERHL